MTNIFSISEAASIALHGVVLVARTEGNGMNVNKISELTGSSRHHIAKIMQRLVKAGFLKSVRGPHGGFTLDKPAQEISLLEIYETIEGKIVNAPCPLNYPVCPFEKCIFDNLLNDLTLQFKAYLERQKLSDYL